MDIVIPSVLVSGLLSGILLFMLKEWHEDRKSRREMFESVLAEHIKTCGDKNVTIGKLEVKICNIEEKVDTLTTTVAQRANKVDKMDEKIDRLHDIIAAQRGIIS